jgi:predicted regulator of Ras-like GTPase activity (Roadblock/LC7/MglB family)
MQTANTITTKTNKLAAAALAKLLTDNPQFLCAFLTDKNGTILTQAGQVPGVALESLSSVVAGAFSASQTMAELLEDEMIHCLCHHGKNKSLLARELSGSLLLVIISSPPLDPTGVIAKTEFLESELAEMIEKGTPDRSIVSALESALSSEKEPIFAKK